MKDNTLKAYPTMFRAKPFEFMILFIGCFLVVGIPIMFGWWLKCICTELKVDDVKSRLRTGVLSKKTNVVMHDSVRNVKVEQGFIDRLLGVGDVLISSSGQSGIEIKIEGIRRPERVRDKINTHKQHSA